MTLHIPTLNDRNTDFLWLFNLAAELSGCGTVVELRFDRCKFLRHNAVALLAAIARMVEHRGGCVHFAWDTMHESIFANLSQLGFVSVFGGGSRSWTGNSVPYREDQFPNRVGIMAYLKSCWLGRGWVSISDPLRNVIAGTIWEIYANAFEHANSPVGLFACGQHYPRLNQLSLTIVDMGVGIPANVRGFLSNPNMSSGDTIDWAFRPGNTTKTGEIGRGGGLDTLKRFTSQNGGELTVYSHRGHAKILQDGERYTDENTGFEGTVFDIKLACDISRYTLGTKHSNDPFF